MVFRRQSSLRPINAIKNVSETSSVIAAATNTILFTIVDTVDAAVLAQANQVSRGATINGFFLSLFFYTEGGEVANEVPLVDWYIIKDNGGQMGTLGFTANGLPTPGAQGTHENKRFIMHSEKGLAGGGDASLAGVPMVFKGVIKVPKGKRRCNINDRWLVVGRTNFATKFCLQCIYKWYS